MDGRGSQANCDQSFIIPLMGNAIWERTDPDPKSQTFQALEKKKRKRKKKDNDKYLASLAQ